MQDRQGPPKDVQYKIFSASVILSLMITLIQYYLISPATATTIIGTSIAGSLIISANLYFIYVVYDTFVDNLIHSQTKSETVEDGNAIENVPSNVVDSGMEIDNSDLRINVDRELLRQNLEYKQFNVSVAATLKHDSYTAIESDIDLLFSDLSLTDETLTKSRYYRIVTVEAVNKQTEQQEVAVSTALPVDSRLNESQSTMDLVSQVNKTIKSVLDEIDTITENAEQIDSDVEFLVEQIEEDIVGTDESEMVKDVR